jgi:hypothetical protein
MLVLSLWASNSLTSAGFTKVGSRFNVAPRSGLLPVYLVRTLMNVSSRAYHLRPKSNRVIQRFYELELDLVTAFRHSPPIRLVEPRVVNRHQYRRRR